MQKPDTLHIAEIVDAHVDAVRGFFKDNAGSLGDLAETLATTFKSGGKLLLCGNGGSASDAQHIAAEFVGRFVENREALPAIALTTDTSILTAVGNDYGFGEIFARQVAALGQAGDILIAISTSGNSDNIMRAVETARARNLKIVALTGKDGGALAKFEGLDFCFTVQHGETARIQECHILFLHILCAMVEQKLGLVEREPGLVA